MDFLKRYRWKQCKLDSKRYYLEKCTIWKQSTYFELYSYFQILLVYICKLKDMLTKLNAGLHFLNSEIKMEKYSARLLSPSVVGDFFNMKWQPVEVALLIIPYIIYYIWNKSDVFAKLVPQGNITVVHRSTHVMFHVCPEMHLFVHSGITILTGS